VRRYSDQMTGSVLERPGLQRALADARVGMYDLLLVYRVDRLARSARGLAQILEELDAARVVFRSATEPFDTGSAAGRMMVQMLGVFAEFERATLIDRVVAGMERKAARGEWHGGKSPFGYAGDTSALSVVDSEAAVVRQIFNLCRDQRLGARAIANWLNEQGFRTRNGKPWGYKTILDMLRNPIYAGNVAFRGSVHPGLHPAIIDRQTFDACTAVLDERGDDYSRRASNSSDYLLAGLLRCTKCRRRFVGTAATGRLYRYRYYTCSGRQQFGRQHGCDAPRIAADRAEQQALEQLLVVFRDTGLVRAGLAKAAAEVEASRPQVTEQLTSLRAEISRTEDVVRRYQLAFEAGTMAAEDCGPRVQELSNQIRDLRAREAELKEAVDARRQFEVTDELLDHAAREIEVALLNGSAAQKKALLRHLIHEIPTDGRHAYPKYRVPMQEVRIVGTLVGLWASG
jgi:site-specific DNA recombinase